MTSTTTPETHAPRAFGWSSVIIIIGTILIAALMLLLVPVVQLPILGTAMIALGMGGRIVMLVGSLKVQTEAVVIGLCYSAVVLGAMCFEPLTTRIIVATVALLILLVIDAIDARITASKK